MAASSDGPKDVGGQQELHAPVAQNLEGPLGECQARQDTGYHQGPPASPVQKLQELSSGCQASRDAGDQQQPEDPSLKDSQKSVGSVQEAGEQQESEGPPVKEPEDPVGREGKSGEQQEPEASSAQTPLDPVEVAARQLRRAAEKGDLATLEQLLDSDPSLATRTDADGYTALHRACYADQVDAARLILDRGPPGLLERPTVDGWRPLHSACKWGSLSCARLLMERGASVNAPSDGGLTPLHLASSQPRSRGVLELLLWAPFADTEARSRAGDRPIDLAARHGPWASLFAMHAPAVNHF
ncbi:uncharacterized protein LOC144120621 [Amblyomma americanum]